MTPFLTCVFFFGLVYCAAGAVYAAIWGSRRAVHDRFTDLADEVRVGDAVRSGEHTGLAQNFLRWARKHMPKPDPESARAEKLGNKLLQAGYISSSAVHTLYILSAILAIVGGLTGLVIGAAISASHQTTIMLVVAFAIIGFLLPSRWVARQARLRQAKITEELPDAIDLLIVCVEAGLGLNEAIKVVGEETERQKEEIGRELALISAEMSAGASLGQAVRGMAERTKGEDIGPLAATLIQNEQLGAKMGPALRASADALRARRKLRAEEAVRKLTVKMLFPLTLLILPAMLMLIAGPAIISIMRAFHHG